MKSGAERDAAVEVALAYLTALGEDDPTAVTRLVATDFVNEHFAELASGCTGRDEYARRLPQFFADFPNRHYSVEETAVGALRWPASVSGPEAVEVIVRYRFAADADAVRLDIPGVMWISVRDGLVVRRLDCWDSLTYHRQTGTTP